MRPRQASTPDMPELLAALDAFVQEHRRCGDLDAGVDPDRVWMTAWGRSHASSRPQPADLPTRPPSRSLPSIAAQSSRL